jgi:hypothetical protein
VQTKTSFSVFACNSAADHTYRYGPTTGPKNERFGNVEKLAEWQRVNTLGLNSGSSPITRRVFRESRLLLALRCVSAVLMGLRPTNRDEVR